jgi:hypothetical protein
VIWVVVVESGEGVWNEKGKAGLGLFFFFLGRGLIKDQPGTGNVEMQPIKRQPSQSQ